LRVAHNRTFDDRIVRVGLKRYYDQADADEPQPSDAWKAGEGFCTSQESRKLCALPKNKLPTLGEAHKILVGRELEGAHNALADTQGCRNVYFAIQDAKA